MIIQAFVEKKKSHKCATQFDHQYSEAVGGISTFDFEFFIIS